MRVVKFQDVLWQTARQAGFSPEEGNLLTNQALSLGEAIRRWVERLYQFEDWPEWVKTIIASPDTNHVVPYDVNFTVGTGTIQERIGRTVHVYLVDPRTTDTPVITDHRLLEEGVHCGYDHGANVWIRYMEPAPRFTAEQWDPSVTYSRDQTTYSFATGDCYRSKVNNNLGNDPSVIGTLPLGLPIPSAVTQQYQPPVLGTPEQDKIIYVTISKYFLGTSGGPIPDPPPNTSKFYIPVLNTSNVILGSATHIATGSQSLDTIGADLAGQLTTALGAGWTITYDVPSKSVRVRNGSDFIVANTNGGNVFPYYGFGSGLAVRPFLLTEVQPYIPYTPPTALTPQIVTVTFSPQQIVPGALYSFTFSDRTPGEHTVTYQSDPSDGVGDILGGIVNAITTASATDPFFAQVAASVNLTGNTISIRSNKVMAVDPTFSVPTSPFWDVLLFPQVLMPAVVRGAAADFLKEWGEVQLGLAAEQPVGVPPDEQNARTTIATVPNAPLSNQSESLSRYKVKP